MNGQRSAPDRKSKVTLSLPQGKTPCPAARELGRQFERALGTQGAYAVKLATVALHWCRAHGATWCDAHGVFHGSVCQQVLGETIDPAGGR